MKPPVARGPRPGQAPVDPKFARRKLASNADRYAEPEPDPYEEGPAEPTSDEERQSIEVGARVSIGADGGRCLSLQAKPMRGRSSSNIEPSPVARQTTSAARRPTRTTKTSTTPCSHACRPPSWAPASAQGVAFGGLRRPGRAPVTRTAGLTLTRWRR